MSYSNVFKGGYIYNKDSSSDKRIIDTNELVASRLEMLTEILKKSEEKEEAPEEGFTEGLVGEEITGLFEENSQSGNVIKGNNPNPDTVLQQAKDKASELISDAKKQADQILADAIEQAEITKKNIIEEARMNGYREGINRASDEIEQKRIALDTQTREMRESYEAKYETMESDLVEAITDIYEHIFHVELSSNREILVYLINTTLRKVEGGRNFIVHVSKDDYPFVSSQKKQLISAGAVNNTIDVVEDLTLMKGECFIETDGGIFDCGLGTQLKQLNKKLRLLSYEN